MTKSSFLIWLFGFSAAAFVWLFSIFLKPFLVASLLVLATYEFSDRIDGRLSNVRINLIAKNKNLITASLLTVIFGVLLFAPIGYSTVYILNDLSGFDISSVQGWIRTVEETIQKSSFLSLQIKNEAIALIERLNSESFWIEEGKNIASIAGGILGKVASSMAELAMVVIFFFLIHWFKKDIVRFFEPLIPLESEQKKELGKEIISAISVVFLTLLGVMAAQGVAFYVLMLFFDYDAAMLGFLSAVSSVVPILGTALVWVPVAANEFLQGNIIGAIIISFYSWFVMAFLIDNFLRLFLLSKVAVMLRSDYKMNEFLLFFSIAAGLATFGFWGFIVGPFVAALFLASSRLLQSSKKIY